MVSLRGLKSVCPHTCVLKKRTGMNSHGEPTWATTLYSGVCRVEDHRRLVRDAEGKEQVSERTVFVPTGVEFTAADRLELTGFADPAPPIISVSRLPAAKAMHHLEVYL